MLVLCWVPRAQIAGGVRARGPPWRAQGWEPGEHRVRGLQEPRSDPSLRGLVETEARGPQACRWPLCLQAAWGPSPSEGLGLPTSGKWYLHEQQAVGHGARHPAQAGPPQLHGGCKRGGVSARGRGQQPSHRWMEPPRLWPCPATASCAAWHTPRAVLSTAAQLQGDRA